MRKNISIVTFLLVIIISLIFLEGCKTQKDGTMSLDGGWLFKIDSLDRGVSENWFIEGADRSDWSKVNVPDYWDRYNLEEYDGVGWYYTSFDLKDISQPMALFFGGVDDDADIWLNGKKVGAHVGYSEPFYFGIKDAMRQGKNELVIRVNDYSGPGGIYKPISVLPLRDVQQLLKTPYADLPARPSEDWVRDAVIYEVYLRSFSKEGSFKALQRKLPELKELGVTVVWLMPIHPVGELNRKGTLGSPYSIQDFYEVNPEFGTLDDFKSLVNETHEQGMKIIIDLVINHTSWDSRLITEHTDWFTKNKEGAIVAPNPDWHDVADLNYNQHELRKYMIQMMEYWVRDIGIDGYRCDVAELVPTDFWELARKQLDKIKPVMMLSEGTLPEHHVGAFDLTYSWNVYDVFEKIIKGSTLVSVFDDIVRNESFQYPQGSLRMRFNTNHDKNAWDNPAVIKFTPQGAKAAAVFTFTYPGVPLIYNGEEVGNDKKLDLFEKVDIEWSKNPDFRQFYKQLGTLRATHSALRRGEFIRLENSDNQKVYSFLRKLNDDQVMVVINFSTTERQIEISLPDLIKRDMREYFSGSTVKAQQGKLALKLAPLEYKVLLPLQ